MNNTTKDSQGFQKGAGNPDVDHEPIPLWKLLLITHDHNQSFQPTILMLCAPYMEQLEDWSKKLIVLMEGHLSHS